MSGIEMGGIKGVWVECLNCHTRNGNKAQGRDKLKEKTDYCTMNNMGNVSNIYFKTYQEAVEFAKFDQPADAPYKIIKRTQNFEIVGEVE